MLRLILNRTVLQLVVSASQIGMLALFVVLWPRQADVPQTWAADYFVAIAVMTPIFMLLSFELRKITSASADDGDVHVFHKQRITGIILSTGLCLTALPLLLMSDMQQSIAIYLAVLTFKISQTLGDQISAHYEWQDDFKGSARSNALKAVCFISVGTITGFVIGPTVAVFAASIVTILIALLYDRSRNAFGTKWMPTSLTNLPRETLAAGGGSFLVSLTLYGPRLIAAAILGEAAILVMGVGQTMNRFGQILSNSLSQTLIVLQKRAGFATGKATALLFGLQVIVLLAMIGTLPLWSHIFSYANGAENFGLAIVLLLIFGLASQFNYLLQSLNLVQHGPRVFIRGPLVFFMTFGAALLATWLLGELGLINLITCMLVARTVQIGYNLIQRRKGDGMT